MIDHLLGRPSVSWKRSQVSPSPPALSKPINTSRSSSSSSSGFGGSQTALQMALVYSTFAVSTDSSVSKPIAPSSPHATLTPACVAEQYTPWQIIVSTLTIVYGARHLDSILGVGCTHLPPRLLPLCSLIITLVSSPGTAGTPCTSRSLPSVNPPIEFLI
jgi:hypothetical protein